MQAEISTGSPTEPPTEPTNTSEPIPIAARAKRSARRRSKADRLAVAEAWVASGLTPAEFAEQHGVTTSSLARWHRELKDAHHATSDGEFVELTVRSDVSTSSVIEIIVDDRRCVRVGPGFDESTLARVICVLERRRSDCS